MNLSGMFFVLFKYSVALVMDWIGGTQANGLNMYRKVYVNNRTLGKVLLKVTGPQEEVHTQVYWPFTETRPCNLHYEFTNRTPFQCYLLEASKLRKQKDLPRAIQYYYKAFDIVSRKEPRGHRLLMLLSQLNLEVLNLPLSRIFYPNTKEKARITVGFAWTDPHRIPIAQIMGRDVFDHLEQPTQKTVEVVRCHRLPHLEFANTAAYLMKRKKFLEAKLYWEMTCAFSIGVDPLTFNLARDNMDDLQVK